MSICGKVFVDDLDDWRSEVRIVTVSESRDLEKLRTLHGREVQLTLAPEEERASEQ